MTDQSEFDWMRYLASLGISDAAVTSLQDERNEVVRARTRDGRELLLKRGKRRTPAGDGALLTEGLVYQLLGESGIADIAPRCILHDRRSDILVTEFLPHPTARAAWDSLGESPGAWAPLGAQLARLHAGTRRLPEWASRLLGPFADLVPDDEPLRPDDLMTSTPGQLQVVRTVQADSAVTARLTDLTDARQTSLIHGDARLDNILVDSTSDVRFVDFELSRVGDPLFDLGSLLGSMIEYLVIDSPPETDEKMSHYIPDVAGRLHDRARAVIAGYRATVRALRGETPDPEDFLSRTAAFVGVHLLHRAGALAHHLHGETRVGRSFSVMGCAFVKNPSVLLRPWGLDASYAWFRAKSGVA